MVFGVRKACRNATLIASPEKNNKKNTTWQRPWTDALPRKAWKWPTEKWKDAPHHYKGNASRNPNELLPHSCWMDIMYKTKRVRGEVEKGPPHFKDVIFLYLDWKPRVHVLTPDPILLTWTHISVFATLGSFAIELLSALCSLRCCFLLDSFGVSFWTPVTRGWCDREQGSWTVFFTSLEALLSVKFSPKF